LPIWTRPWGSYQPALLDQEIAVDEGDRQALARHVEAMDAEALQPLEYDAAVAQEVLGDDRLGDIHELVGRRIDRALRDRAALGDEDDQMPVGDPLHAFDQQFGR